MIHPIAVFMWALIAAGASRIAEVDERPITKIPYSVFAAVFSLLAVFYLIYWEAHGGTL